MQQKLDVVRDDRLESGGNQMIVVTEKPATTGSLRRADDI
jgi:hypothetical protein